MSSRLHLAARTYPAPVAVTRTTIVDFLSRFGTVNVRDRAVAIATFFPVDFTVYHWYVTRTFVGNALGTRATRR